MLGVQKGSRHRALVLKEPLCGESRHQMDNHPHGCRVPNGEQALWERHAETYKYWGSFLPCGIFPLLFPGKHAGKGKISFLTSGSPDPAAFPPPVAPWCPLQPACLTSLLLPPWSPMASHSPVGLLGFCCLTPASVKMLIISILLEVSLCFLCSFFLLYHYYFFSLFFSA